MNRRDVLAKMGALSVGMAVPGLAKGEAHHKPYQVQSRKTDTQVLVIDGGTAGVVAAIQAGKHHPDRERQLTGWYHDHRRGLFSRYFSRLGQTGHRVHWLGTRPGSRATERRYPTQFLHRSQ